MPERSTRIGTHSASWRRSEPISNPQTGHYERKKTLPKPGLGARRMGPPLSERHPTRPGDGSGWEPDRELNGRRGAFSSHEYGNPSFLRNDSLSTAARRCGRRSEPFYDGNGRRRQTLMSAMAVSTEGEKGFCVAPRGIELDTGPAQKHGHREGASRSYPASALSHHRLLAPDCRSLRKMTCRG